MPFNEEKSEEHVSKPATTKVAKNEFQTSLDKIVRQVNDLSRFTEGLFGKLDKEVGRVSFKLKVLQENVIQLTDVIVHNILNEELSMQDRKPIKTLPSETIPVHQVYSCTSLLVKIFEKKDANVEIPFLTFPAYYKDDSEDSTTSSDNSLCSCSYCHKHLKEERVSVSKEHKIEQLTQNKNLDNINAPQSAAQHQLIEDDVSVDCIPAVNRKVSQSYLDQLGECSSFYIFPFNKTSKLQGISEESTSPSDETQGLYEIGNMVNSYPRVLYGTGRGKVLPTPPPPPPRQKIEVFVNPMAPEPPPLPPDWLVQLRASRKKSQLSNIIHFPEKSSLLLLKTSATASTPAYIQTTPDTDLQIIPPRVQTSPPNPEPCEYYEFNQDDLSSQDEYQRSPSPLFPIVTSLCDQSCDSVMYVVDAALVVQPPGCSVFQSTMSFAHIHRSSMEKSSSVNGPFPQNPVANISSSLIAQLPISPTEPQCSVTESTDSSCSQIKASSNTSLKHSVSDLTKLIEAQSSRLVMTKPENQPLPSQSRPSHLRTTEIPALQSSLYPMISPSSISSTSALPVSHCLAVSTCTCVKQSPPVLPIITKARKTLMEAIRKGVQICKTTEYIPQAETEAPLTEADMIRIRRKEMGYNSGKSDTETAWME